jgi:hypothetical protein
MPEDYYSLLYEYS